MISENEKQEVRVTDIRMPFGSMVLFMVKWAIASIPAFVILFALGALLWAGVVAFIASLTHPSRQVSSTTSGSVVGGSVAAPSQANAEQVAYLSNILLSKINVGKDVLDETGVFGEVKNTGDRTLKRLEITIYCLGPDAKPIFEKTYRPVFVTETGFGDSNQPLKPGYSRQFGVKMDDAPSEWSKKVSVKVTSVEFQ
jgi:hypothetical protein